MADSEVKITRNFVGKVTRHLEKAGVTLRARVTDPDKRVSAYQNFKCTVKSTGLSDEQCVILSLNRICNNLNAKGVTGIKESLSSYMPTTDAAYGTTITYEVSSTGSVDITEYFNSDGIVSKRPEYGQVAVVGSLVIRVTKNEAYAIRTISISIDPYSFEEVKASIQDLLTWDKIKGNNWGETELEITSGPSNVIYPLNLIQTVSCPLLGDNNSISISWSIKQDELSEILDQARINLSDGTIYRPEYMDIWEQKTNYASYDDLINYCNVKIEHNKAKNFFRLGGLVLKATYSVQDTISGASTPQTIEFNLKTLSKAISNTNITDSIGSTDTLSSLVIRDTKYNIDITTSVVGDVTGSVKNSAYADALSVNSSEFVMYNKADVITALQNMQLIGPGQEYNISSVEWSVVKHETISSSTMQGVTKVDGLVYSGSGITGTDASHYRITIDPPLDSDGVSTLIVDNTMVLRCVITVSGYTNSEGSSAYSTLTVFYWFNVVDKSSGVAPSVIPT